MRATAALHDAGQSLWLDNITRTMLDDGTIARYIAEYSVTGLTSNPAIFEKAIESGAYDASIAAHASAPPDEVFFELAIADLQRAADLFAPTHATTEGVDGWVSLEVSPELARDTAATVAAARELHARAQRPNLFIKIPGTPEGLPAVTECIAAGIPVNVTLLFDADQYLAAAQAYAAGVERRIAAGQSADVRSVASVFMSRWDRAVVGKLTGDLANQLGLAIGRVTYRAYREFLAGQRWAALAAAGAKPQRLLWASTSSKDPAIPDTHYVDGLAAPDTINTMPDVTLEAYYNHGSLGSLLPDDGGDGAAVLDRIHASGIDVTALAATLQVEGAEAFVKSWRALLDRVASKAASSQ